MPTSMREYAFSRAASNALAYDRVGVASGPAAIALVEVCWNGRSFNSALDAARENAYSRMLVGIHFRRACEVGLIQGRDVARAVLKRAPFLDRKSVV